MKFINSIDVNEQKINNYNNINNKEDNKENGIINENNKNIEINYQQKLTKKKSIYLKGKKNIYNQLII